jgi:hypothetical protein
LTEDEAISLISIGVDFGVTQVVDGNWGIHAVIKKDPVRRHPYRLKETKQSAAFVAAGYRIARSQPPSRDHDRRPIAGSAMPQHQIDPQWIS